MKHIVPARLLLLHAPLFTVISSLLAQQPPATTATKASAPILVLQTTRAALVTRVADAFGVGLHLPEPAAGQHYELACAARGRCDVRTVDGDVGYLRLRGDPAALATAFAEEIEAIQPIVQAGMMVGLQQQGFQAREVGAFLKELWSFPRQLQQFRLRVDGDPQRLADGLTVTLDVDPLPGGYVAKMVDALEPGPAGAPLLPAEDALIRMRCSLAPTSLQTVLGPFAELGLRMTHRDEGAQQKARAFNDRWMRLYDGCFAMTFVGDLTGSMLIGVSDPARLDELLASDDYRQMLEQQQLPGQDVEYLVTRDALEHRGYKWLRTSVTGATPSPFLPEGTFVSHVGRVGRYMAMAMGGDAGAARLVIDAVEDGKVKRTALADGAVLDVEVDFRAMMQLGAKMAGNPVGRDRGVPERVGMTLARRGSTLHWVTKLR